MFPTHQYPEDLVSPEQTLRVMLDLPIAIRLLKRVDRWKGNTVVRMNTYDLLKECKHIMSRRKVENGSVKHPGSNTGGGFGQSAKFRWNNVRFTADDVEYLNASSATLEQLAASLLGLVDDGYGFSAKPSSEGKSVVVSLNRPSVVNPGVINGVSAFAPNVRDGLLALLYKFDHYLGGELTDDSEFGAVEKPRFG